MRILTVSHFYESHGGGIERVAGYLCRQFALKGHMAEWAASASDPYEDSNVQAVPLTCANPIEKLVGLPMPIPYPRSWAVLAQAVKRSDAVVVHDALYVTSLLALVLARWNAKPVVLVQHIAGIPFSSRFLRSLMKLANATVTRSALRAATARVFISDTVKQELLGTNPRLSSDLLFNGVDRSLFYPSDHLSCQQARPEPAERDGRRQALFVGRFVEKKGLNVLRELASQRPDVDFVLIGQGPIRPEQWLLPNIVNLGPQTPQRIAELYREADFLILPSMGEGYPLVIQEAMACGLPVICGAPTDRADPAASKWLRGVEIDLSDPAGSAHRCNSAIDALAASSSCRMEMASYAARTYDWSTTAEGIIRLAKGRRSQVDDHLAGETQHGRN